MPADRSERRSTRVSVVIPTWREAANVVAAIASARDAGADEIVVSDGGSDDATVARARAAGATVVLGARGRGPQMNVGAAATTGEVLLFLHADTRLPGDAVDRIRRAMRDEAVVGGRFDVRLDAPGALLRVVETLINVRSRLTGLFTGDQAMFVRRAVFERLGGFESIPLFEDLRFARRLRRAGRVVAFSDRVTTSARRWTERGPLRTVLLMWRLRAAHAMGADPSALARRYSSSSG